MSVLSEDHIAARTRGPGREQWRQMLLISVAALALYAGVRRLPTGTNLSHMDFRAGGNGVEFCDPANPQFIPVVAMRSPVTMTLAGDGPAVGGAEVRRVATLQTSTGKPVAPADLLVVHTQKLHLLIVDPTLTDYQHVHPTPGRVPGRWEFAFTPRQAGAYRVFADFTPAATARGLYASADLEVTPGAAKQNTTEVPVLSRRTYEANGYIFELRPAEETLRAGRVIDLTFSVSRPDGGAVPLQPVMDAYAHLVAFDEERSGFAHLHPNEVDLSRPPDSRQPRLTFKVTIPRAGRYVIWSQLKLDGRDTFAPFSLEVLR